MKAIPLITALVLGLSLPVLAAAPPPIPKLRPERVEPPAKTTLAVIPVPRLRAGKDAITPPPAAEEPPEKDAPAAEDKPPEEKNGWPAPMVADARAACGRLLSGIDITYKQLDPIGDEGGCGAPAPILISSVAGVALVPPATLTCDMAQALSGWVEKSVKPAAQDRLHTEVTEIRTATSYACRRRNNGSSGKMSEHSKANGLDLSGFSFARKTNVTVGGGGWGEGLLDAVGLSGNGSFLDTIRKSACVYFTTVLGPGSDPYHGDHFHVDVLRRKGDYRICQ